MMLNRNCQCFRDHRHKSPIGDHCTPGPNIPTTTLAEEDGGYFGLVDVRGALG
jgi:hypothetical protein